MLSSCGRLPWLRICRLSFHKYTNISSIKNMRKAILWPHNPPAVGFAPATFVPHRRLCSLSTVIFHVDNEEDFAENVMKSPVPVLVDFYADWCGPCKMLGPRIEAKVLGQEGSIRLAQVNVDYAADLAMEYNVNSVPTVVAIKFGVVVGRFEGLRSDDELDQFIEDLLHTNE